MKYGKYVLKISYPVKTCVIKKYNLLLHHHSFRFLTRFLLPQIHYFNPSSTFCCLFFRVFTLVQTFSLHDQKLDWWYVCDHIRLSVESPSTFGSNLVIMAALLSAFVISSFTYVLKCLRPSKCVPRY